MLAKSRPEKCVSACSGPECAAAWAHMHVCACCMRAHARSRACIARPSSNCMCDCMQICVSLGPRHADPLRISTGAARPAAAAVMRRVRGGPQGVAVRVIAWQARWRLFMQHQHRRQLLRRATALESPAPPARRVLWVQTRAVGAVRFCAPLTDRHLHASKTTQHLHSVALQSLLCAVLCEDCAKTSPGLRVSVRACTASRSFRRPSHCAVRLTMHYPVQQS